MITDIDMFFAWLRRGVCSNSPVNGSGVTSFTNSNSKVATLFDDGEPSLICMDAGQESQV